MLCIPCFYKTLNKLCPPEGWLVVHLFVVYAKNAAVS